MSKKPWYQDGLRFECSGCGDCCTGAPGYVWVNDEEIHALAERGGVSAEDFEAAFVRRVGRRKSLIEHPNGDCIFFDSAARRCHVYPLRPRQCRTFPFWDSCICTPEDWRRTCKACPGAGKGEIIPLTEIQARKAIITI